MNLKLKKERKQEEEPESKTRKQLKCYSIPLPLESISNPFRIVRTILTLGCVHKYQTWILHQNIIGKQFMWYNAQFEF